MHLKTLAAAVSIALTLGVQAAPSTFDRAADVRDLLKRSYSHGIDMSQVSKRATALVAKKRELNHHRRDGKRCKQPPKTTTTTITPAPSPASQEPPTQEPPKQEPPKQEPPKQEPPKQEPPTQEPPTKAPTTEEPTKDINVSNTGSENNNNVNTAPDNLAQQWLDAHNAARAKHGASPLTWSDDLANTAQNWGSGCVFEHSGGPHGENLAAQSGSTMTPDDAVKMWMDEVGDYNPSSPQASHFTQVVWKGSSRLGCAIVTCAPGKIFAGTTFYGICEYDPAGNVIGNFAENVQK